MLNQAKASTSDNKEDNNNSEKKAEKKKKEKADKKPQAPVEEGKVDVGRYKLE